MAATNARGLVRFKRRAPACDGGSPKLARPEGGNRPSEDNSSVRRIRLSLALSAGPSTAKRMSPGCVWGTRAGALCSQRRTAAQNRVSAALSTRGNLQGPEPDPLNLTHDDARAAAMSSAPAACWSYRNRLFISVAPGALRQTAPIRFSRGSPR
jgi:hypothetical protein